MSCVGLFFVVKSKLIFENISIHSAEKYGDFLIYTSSHYDVWITKYEKTYHKSYDFYPRGRVVFHQPTSEYVIYADQCISNNMLLSIQTSFGLIDKQFRIDQSDLHYVCHLCSKFYFDI